MEQTIFKRGATYIRVSTHMQDELSPDAQRRLLLEYAAAHHITIASQHMYEDAGISGRRADKRPQFLRMISDAKSPAHPFDVILVWKFSRFARNQEESIVYKSLLHRQCQVEVISITEPIIEGPFGSLIERIIEWMDEYYSIRLSGEVLRGMKEKALRGGYQSRPPLGYRIAAKKEPPVIVPGEAQIVRYIFDQYVNCHASSFSIAKDLNAKGVKTSMGKDFERRSVEYILQNPIYCGLIRWNRTEHASGKVREKSEWILTPGHHDPIIDRELFDKAQKRFLAEQTDRKPSSASSRRHWLSGILKCPRCGRSMTSCKTGKYRYFVCYGYLKGKCSCSSHISQSLIQEAVLASIKEMLGNVRLQFSHVSPPSTPGLDERAGIEEQLSKLEEKENRIKAAYRNGVDTLEEYQENKELLRQEQKRLEEHLSRMERQQSPEESELSNLPSEVANVYELLLSDAPPEIKNQVIGAVVERIVYDKQADVLRVHYRCIDLGES